MLGLAHPPFDWDLNPDEVHMAQRFREAGYHTVLVGVQHVTPQPAQRLGYDTVIAREPAEVLGGIAGHQIETLAHQDQPFYLEVGFTEPHRPFDRWGIVADDTLGVALPHYVPDTAEARADFAALQGSIKALDSGVARIHQALEETGRAENTWLVFVADHGLAMPMAKCTLYDPGIETALIMHYPAGGLTGGRRIRELTSHIDVLPTLLDGLGLPLPENLHGRSAWPLITGRGEYQPNDVIFAEKTFHEAYEPMRCVRTDRHKLILNLDTGSRYAPSDIQQCPFFLQAAPTLLAMRPYIELYDLTTDPHERNNLAAQPEQNATEKALKNRLRTWMEDTGDPVLKGVVTPVFQQRALDALYADS
jgi:arylsulfatase A-like enzyme